MDVQEVSAAGYAYGYIYGSFNGCGWTAIGYLQKSDSTVANRCSTEDATRKPSEAQMFSEWSDPAHPDGVDWHTIGCAPAGATRSGYGNYRGDFKNKYGEMPVNHKVDWRYTTKDGNAVMVKDTSNPIGAPVWFFMPRACVAPGPPVPASAPPPPAQPAPGTPPTPGGKARKKRKVCWKTSKSRYCKKLRRTCRRHKSHSARCRRALRGKPKKRRSRASRVQVRSFSGASGL